MRPPKLFTRRALHLRRRWRGPLLSNKTSPGDSCKSQFEAGKVVKTFFKSPAANMALGEGVATPDGHMAQLLPLVDPYEDHDNVWMLDEGCNSTCHD